MFFEVKTAIIPVLLNSPKVNFLLKEVMKSSLFLFDFCKEVKY